jgi:hypothetical protein
MLALDLFNTPFERALNEGAVDDLEARRIHHLNTRMLELMSRANDADFKASSAGLAGLKREYQKLKDERDSYYKVREAGIPGSVPTEKIPGKEDLLKGKGRSYYEATGDDKFDAMMGKISKDPWTQLNSDPNWEYEIEELVDQQIEPWLLAMEKSGMPITRDEETLNPGWRKRYEQVANKLAQEFLTSRGLNPRDPDLVGKIRYAIDWHTDESKNVHGQLSAYSDLPLARYAGAFDADGMTANMRDAMVGFIRTDDDDDDEPPTRPMPDNDPRRLDPGNMEEGNFVLASEPENPEEKEKRDAVARAKTAEIAQDHARTRKRDILQSYAQIGRMRTEMIWAIDNYVYMNKEQILDYIDKKSRDPALSALEYMHDLGHDVDGLFKNVTRFLTGTGVSPAKIQAVQNKITKRMGDINERRLAEKIDVVNDPSQARPITRNAQGITTGAVYSGKYDGGIDAKVRAREQWIKLVQAKFPTAKIFQARSINGQVFAILPDGRKIYMRDSLSETENAISTDAKGRTQQQWIKLVQTKFPTAKIMQAKMIDGPVFATLPDGRKISWKKVETSNDQKKNSALGEKKLGQLRPTLGTGHDVGRSVKKFRAQRGLDEHGGGIGPRQHWQDLMPEQMNPEDYEDEDEDLRLRSGDYVRDTMDGEYGEIFRMQGDPYERRVRILDRDGKGWYIEPSRLARVDPTDPDVQRYFGRKRVRDMDESDVAEGKLTPEQSAELKGYIDTYRDATDPEGYYDIDGNNPDPGEILGTIAGKFGQSIADKIANGPSMHFSRDNHSMDSDWYDIHDKTSRATKSGKINRQDVNVLKRNLKTRAGNFTKPNLPEQGVAEGKADYNFDAEDLKRLERIRDLPTLKTQALALISRPSAKPMKPEKVEWFKNALDRMNSPIKVIKLMYDLLLSGEGHAVVGSRSSMNPNSYRQRFGEQGVEEGWSDAMVARRTGGPRTPYSVYIKGKKWKDFENEDHAQAVANKLRAKFKADGRDPETVTIAPTDYDRPIKEEQDTSGVERAILNRIMVAHTDLLMKFGPDKVMQAAEEVAYNVGDVDEIGTSDVSAYVAQVKQILGAVSESKLEEKWSNKYKSSINCANPKGFSQKAHCAGKNKE